MWHPSNEQISALLRCKIIRMKNWYITILGWLLAWVTKRTRPESQKNGVVNWWAWTAYFPVFWSSPKATSNIWLYSSTKWTSRPSFTFSASSSKSLLLAEGNMMVFTSLLLAAIVFSLTWFCPQGMKVLWDEMNQNAHNIAACQPVMDHKNPEDPQVSILRFKVVIIFFEFDFRKVWNIFMPNICMK